MQFFDRQKVNRQMSRWPRSSTEAQMKPLSESARPRNLRPPSDHRSRSGKDRSRGRQHHARGERNSCHHLSHEQRTKHDQGGKRDTLVVVRLQSCHSATAPALDPRFAFVTVSSVAAPLVPVGRLPKPSPIHFSTLFLLTPL